MCIYSFTHAHMCLGRKKIFQINIKCLKIAGGRQQTNLLFTQHSWGYELRVAKNKSGEK